MRASEVIAPMKALKRVEMVHEWRLLREGPPRLKRLEMIKRRKQTYLWKLS
jgi:hypothetical protein